MCEQNGPVTEMRRPNNTPGIFERVYDVVRMIPWGQVATYGQIAAIVSHRNAARTVGWALASLKNGTDVPWHRVVNSRGFVSLRDLGQPSEAQCTLLGQEGIIVGQRGEVNLRRHQWRGLDWPEVEALRQTWATELQGDDDPGID
jgi:methylated-DNA-protein-cysteine methyltransferase-like protein